VLAFQESFKELEMVERIGHYRIVAELGRGGMGVVYKAHEESLNRFVAIKVLGEHLMEDPTQVQRFIREAQSAASLNHPNIVQIYAVSEEDGLHYFVMEYVSGRSLQQILRARGPLESEQVARIALQTASGLQAAHEHGIIHRDIKPANLLIDDRGLVKIADFGLALMGAAASRLTATGMFMGTPGYLSPEQCLDREVDNRTDIYSLGVTLFEALSGKTPFVADSPLALLRQIVDVEPPDLGELNPEVDPELRAVVARMMAKDRDLRISSCGELIGAFEAYLEARGAAGNLVERLAVSPPATPPQPVAIPTLDTEPTTAMSGDPSPPGSPPGPPQDTAPPAARTEPLIVETSPLENEPTARRGTSLALVAALVVVLGLAAVVIAGFFAWRAGFFEAATRLIDHDLPTATPVSVETADPSSTTSPTGPGNADDQTMAAAEAAPSVEPTLAPPTARPIPTTDPGRGVDQLPPPAGANIHRPRDVPQRDNSRQPPPPMPRPTGTIVIAVGETVFAGEAEAFMEEALSNAGIPLVDEYSVPGAADLLAGDTSREPSEVHRLLRPYARNVVIVRVEYLGERPLVYMGQQDVAFQARVTVATIDVQGGRPLAQPIKFKVEYTHLSAQRVAENRLRAPARRVVQLIEAE
jgi:serine/threonine protein kinase